MPAASPTVIITSCRDNAGQPDAMTSFDLAWGLAQILTPCGLPIVLVTDGALRATTAASVGQTTVHQARLHTLHPLDRHIEALVEGVLLSAHAPGWIWLPSDTPMMRPLTVSTVAQSLASNPLVHAEHIQQAGIPLGVGAELYSELIQLGGHRDLQRFRARYPALAVPVSDPGVVMSVAGSMRPTPKSHSFPPLRNAGR
jgi:CTP:molybdopterin cytidylyltransferase MocA